MKKIYFLFVLISLHVTGFATTWYSQGTGDPSSTSNWNSVSTGTGSSPTNFTTSGDVFIMQTNMSGGSGTWTLGTGTTLQLSSVTFYDYFGTINCYNLSLTGSTNLYGETANYFYVSGDFSASGTSVMTNPPSWNYFYFTNTASSLSSPQHCTMTTTGSGNYTYMYVNTGVTVAFTANNTWNTSSSTFSISGTLDCGTYSFGGSCPFVLNSGATLYTGMAGGVNSAIVSTGGTTFATGATYGFTGTAAQVTGSLMPASLVSPAKLIINNAAGVTLSQSTANTNTTGALTFIAGNLNTGSNSLTIPGVSTAISGAGSSNYVIGTLMKTISGNSAINYEVGYSTTYTPMQLTLSSSGSSGSLGVAVTHGLHASVGTSGLRGGQMVNDYWTITNSGAAGPATVIPLATYPSGDILGGAGNSGFVTRNYSASSWLGPYQTTNNTSPTTSATTTGVPLASLAGDYIFGIMGGISGNLSVCPGLSSTLTDSISGGTWSSGSPTVAAIGSISGIVTGLSGGTSIITYTIGGATSIATVTVVPIAAITGTSIVCIGNATPFTHSTSGGTWSSSNPAQASVGSSTGLVTGLTSGTATITYTLPGGCISTLPVTVNASPASITGTSSVCPGFTTALGDATTGGTWSSSNTSLATVGSSSGVVTGIAGGNPVISYTSAAGCSATQTMTVNSMAPILGVLGVCATGITSSLTDATPGGTWSSSNTGVATIGSISGVATSIGSGVSTITYTVASTGCIATAVFGVTGTPNVYTVTGGGGYCAGGTGVSIGLSGSDAGVSYRLFNGSALAGTAISGVGYGFSFPPMATAGTYSVIANPGSACATTMTGSATVVINPLPTAFSVTGGGSYCTGGTGVHVGLGTSTIGVNYQLFNGTTAIGSPVSGTGAALDFGLLTATGTYTVFATNTTTGCVNNMSGSVTISTNLLPTVYSVTGGGAYCSGGSGVTVGLSGSDAGVSYQLYFGGSPVSGAVVSGTGSAFSFVSPITAGGSYTVVATNTTTGCISTMAGSATVVVNVLPTVFNVTGGGAYCVGGTGVHIGLNASTVGVNYQIYRGTTAVGAPIAGTGVSLDFGLFTIVGSYTISATNATTGCTMNMSGSASVSTNPLPNLYTVTGGGGYCSGGSGVHVGLNSSEPGIIYQLYNGSSLWSASAGTGSAIDFGLETAAGFYSITATNSITGCISTMTGGVTVSINPLPVIFAVTGGGSYCAGGTGVHIGTTSSTTGVNYQLFAGSSPSGTFVAGTGFGLDFGLKTAAGSYTVVATNPTTSCTNIMSSSASVNINPLPPASAVTGGGGYCAGGTGVHIGVSGSITGVSYQLYISGTSLSGSPVAGTGSAIDFGLRTVAGTYTVVGINTTTGCSGNMTGSVVVTVNPLPTAYNVTGGGGYCAGSSGSVVGLNTSTIGVSYQLINGSTPIGTAIPGSGTSISFGPQTVAGTYTVIATNTVTGCSNTMSGSVVVGVNPLPTAFNVTGGGSYCTGGTGVHIGLSASTPGIGYVLYNSGLPVTLPMSGTGAALDFGLRTAPGTYTIVATNTATSCTNTMAGSAVVSINPLPAIFLLTGGGNYCFGTPGVDIGLSGSAVGTNYQLYLGSSLVGPPLVGTGSSLDFGMQTSVGTYNIIATNTVTGCTTNMGGSTNVNINPLPVLHLVTGGGNYCPGGTGVHVYINGSETGINYQLFNGSSTIGPVIPGTGLIIDFGLQTAPGTYTVVATDAVTGCSAGMTGSVAVGISSLPAAFNVTGTGNYCPGGAGVHVGLSGSDLGTSYQLYNTTGPAGTTIAGTGLVIDFGLELTGTYTVIATSGTTFCSNNMNGSAIVTISALPTSYNVTGGGSYCAGGTGVHIGLDGSDPGISYQLSLSGIPAGSPMTGTGSALDFGLKTAGGTYTVIALSSTTTCSNNMTGSSLITVNPLPIVFTVTGGGNYCTGGTGVHVMLSGSTVGINYQLFR